MFSIKVKVNSDYNESWLFERKFNTKEEFETVANYCSSRKRTGFLESSIITVRTDNSTDFCKDFFLPTFVNRAKMVTDTASKILAIPISLIADISTMIFRIITIIPRYFYNAHYSRETHPFHQYLTQAGADARLLKTNHIYLSFEWKDSQNRIEKEETLNFIDLPEYAIHFAHSCCARGQLARDLIPSRFLFS